MKPSKIFLIGMPGSGKTTLGTNLAEYVGIPFLDLDEIIVADQNKAVAQIFEESGEEEFRKIERNSLKETIQKFDQFVLATGGGTPCFFDNIDLIIQNGISIFIDTPLEEIARRLDQAETAKRPLMTGWSKDNVIESLKEKFESRKIYYTQAHLTIKGDESIKSISSKILDLAGNSKN